MFQKKYSKCKESRKICLQFADPWFSEARNSTFIWSQQQLNDERASLSKPSRKELNIQTSLLRVPARTPHLTKLPLKPGEWSPVISSCSPTLQNREQGAQGEEWVWRSEQKESRRLQSEILSWIAEMKSGTICVFNNNLDDVSQSLRNIVQGRVYSSKLNCWITVQVYILELFSSDHINVSYISSIQKQKISSSI